MKTLAGGRRTCSPVRPWRLSTPQSDDASVEPLDERMPELDIAGVVRVLNAHGVRHVAIGGVAALVMQVRSLCRVDLGTPEDRDRSRQGPGAPGPLLRRTVVGTPRCTAGLVIGRLFRSGLGDQRSRSTTTVRRSVPIARTMAPLIGRPIALSRSCGSSSSNTRAVPVRQRRPILSRTRGFASMLRT